MIFRLKNLFKIPLDGLAKMIQPIAPTKGGTAYGKQNQLRRLLLNGKFVRVSSHASGTPRSTQKMPTDSETKTVFLIAVKV